MQPERKRFYILAAVVVVLIAVLILMSPPKWTSPVPAAPASVVTNLPTSSIPEKFPPGLPMEAGATIVSNYNATSADGRIQATRSFESAKSVSANFKLYKTFIMNKTNGWIYLNEVNDQSQPNNKALFASGMGGILGINISAAVTPGHSVVDLSFVAPSK